MSRTIVGSYPAALGAEIQEASGNIWRLQYKAKYHMLQRSTYPLLDNLNIFYCLITLYSQIRLTKEAQSRENGIHSHSSHAGEVGPGMYPQTQGQTYRGFQNLQQGQGDRFMGESSLFCCFLPSLSVEFLDCVRNPSFFSSLPLLHPISYLLYSVLPYPSLPGPNIQSHSSW